MMEKLVIKVKIIHEIKTHESNLSTVGPFDASKGDLYNQLKTKNRLNLKFIKANAKLTQTVTAQDDPQNTKTDIPYFLWDQGWQGDPAKILISNADPKNESEIFP